MIIKEFRITLPMTVEEYQIAQLYSVAQASKNETGGGEGIEVLKNEPFTPAEGVQPKSPLLNGQYHTGQFTHKIYHLASKVPAYIRWLAPKGSLEIHEEAWNAYPYCRTVVTNPDYMKENFVIKIETIHLPGRGDEENAHGLPKELLSKRDVVTIDIANDPVDRRDYKADEDPSKYKSEKTGRGPLQGEWKKEVEPVMTCYKLVTVEFKWFGLQGRVEKFIHKAERRIFTNFHRQVFCWTDLWHGLTMKDIRELEEKTKQELDEAHGLDPETLRKREVVVIDIANDPVDRRDYKPEEDPSRFKSQKTGRGPLVGPGWKNQVDPVMTCYKLVTVEFKWWGLQGKVEKFIHKAERRIFTNFHRQVFCWTDLWHGLTMKDIREIEDRTKRELDEQIKTGEVRGTKEEE